MKILYKELNFKELNKLRDINRRQEIKEKYRLENKELVLYTQEIYVEKWDSDELEEYILRLRDIHKNQGLVLGAFKQNKEIIGIAALDKRPLDREGQYVNLDMIYISYGYRKMGIGKTLVGKLIKEAKKTKASYLYISSSDFKETVDFYMSLGAKICEPIGHMYEKEPEDIHMAIKL